MNGAGPVKIIATIKTVIPYATNFAYSFCFSGIKFRKKDVNVYVIVSIEKINPIARTDRFSFFNRI